MQARRRNLVAVSVVLAAHAAVFVALAKPGRTPIRPATASLVSLGPGVLLSFVRAAPSTSSVAAPPTPVLPPSPPPPEPATPESPALEPAPPAATESVSALAARLIAQTTSPLQLSPIELSTAAPSPPPPLQAAAGSAGDQADCDITETLRGALQQDLTVQAALARVPRSARSVAGAIMLWDGGWVEAAALGGPDAAGPIRTAIVEQVRFEPPACRDKPVSGPRFIVIVGAPAATVLTLGSGQWRWADLLESPTGDQ